MYYLFCQIYITGTKKCIEFIANNAKLQDGEISQLGQKRKVPSTDHWMYSTPSYRLHEDWDKLENELLSFVEFHKEIGEAIDNCPYDIKTALLSLSPAGQSFEYWFAMVLGRSTINLINKLGVGLEIAPMVSKPEVPYWVDELSKFEK